jgi:hypothetical protein
MKDQGSTARRQLTRCLNAIDEEYLVILAPLIIRIIANRKPGQVHLMRQTGRCGM